MAEETLLLYALAGVFLVYSFFDSMKKKWEIGRHITEPLLKKHFWWHSFLVFFIVLFYEIPIVSSLFRLAVDYAAARQVAFAAFIIAAFFTIKPLFDLSRTYSFRKEKPLVTELVLFAVFLAFLILILSGAGVQRAVAQYFAPLLAVMLAASGLLYYYAGTRLSSAFNEPNLRNYISAHSLLVLLVFLLNELEFALQVGVIAAEYAQLVGLVGIVALAGAVELEKSLALQYVRAFSREYSFTDQGSRLKRKKA